MKNKGTNEPLRLIVPVGGGALLRLPDAQLPEVRTLFDQHNVNYWWNEWAFDASGTNPTTSITISVNENTDRVQALLDAST